MTLMPFDHPAPPVLVEQRRAVEVSHVADCYHRYRGEPVRFHTRVHVHERVQGFMLRIELPSTATVSDTRASANYGGRVPDIVEREGKYNLDWLVVRPLDSGDNFEFEVEAVVGPVDADGQLESEAKLIAGLPDSQRVSVGESARVRLRSKSRYLRYLPMLYEDDELMGRFLMLFESFWAPIEDQIDQVSHYFDPRTTTSDMLPFLASWVDLEPDGRWPEDRQRNLLLAAARLHRRRGTKQGMRTILELYTGGQAQITEYISSSFTLGPNARLGRSIALGRGNKPHSFAVHLKLPPLEESDEVRRTALEHERRQTIVNLIEANKPAHTSYTLWTTAAADEAGEDGPAE